MVSATRILTLCIEQEGRK